MKKSTLIGIVVVIIAILCGGFYFISNQLSNNQIQARYTSAMSAGKSAVEQKDYDQAKSDFTKAYAIKNTDEASAYASQAGNMSDAESDIKEAQYDDAINELNAVIDQAHGYDVMVSQAKSLKRTINEVKDNYTNQIKPLLDKAQQAETDKDYSSEVDYFKQVLALPYINGKYYKEYKQEATNGLEQAQALLKNQQKSKKTSSAEEDTGTAGTTGAGAMGDHKVNGKTVKESTIDAIRKRITALGYDGSSWSPQDIIDLYRQAYANGHKTADSITADDINAWLK
ncbi:MAG: hypothetical protein Q3960_02815 [Lactobacillus sp.]|nr:hypothetical protein [Lactobacillus sp.]